MMTPRVIERPKLAAPRSDMHKYSRGMVAVVSGEMPGAALLAAAAAMRIAGYVVLVGGDAGGPMALVRKPWDAVARDQRIGAVLVGPGLGLSPDSRAILTAVLGTRCPLVIDGDALTIMAQTQPPAFPDARHPVIITPHAGEFNRLFPGLPGTKIEQAHAAARQSGTTVVFKGPQTVIATPDGAVVIGPAASPWLASAGTGDVLAGIIAALVATGLAPLAAASAAVWLHSECARLAGPALIADDLPPLLARAVAQCL